MPAPSRFNLTATHRTLWDRTFTLRSASGAVLNLTGMGALFQVRSSVDSPVNVVSASNADGRITIGGAEGTVRISLSPADLSIEAGEYVYGLALIDSLGRLQEPFLEGQFTLRRGIPSL